MRNLRPLAALVIAFVSLESFGGRQVLLVVPVNRSLRDTASELVTLRCRFTNWDKTRVQSLSVAAVNELNETGHVGSFTGTAMPNVNFTMPAFTGTVPATHVVMWGYQAGNPGYCATVAPGCIIGIPSSLTINVAEDRGAVSASCLFQYKYQPDQMQTMTHVTVNSDRPF